HVKDFGRAVLDWLAAAGRRVINGRGVFELEVSKIRQHGALTGHGFDVPRTAAAFGSRALVEAARDFTPPFITKHNQGGKGLGVRLFDYHAELESAAEDFAPGGACEPIEGHSLRQVNQQPAQPFITRAEFIGGRFHYAVRVDVSDGSFELCPADACEIPRAEAGSGAAAPFSRREEITASTP